MFPTPFSASSAIACGMRCAPYAARSKGGEGGGDDVSPEQGLDVEAVITELGVGEALVSFLNDKGQPNVVDRALIFPPQSQLAPLYAAERKRP